MKSTNYECWSKKLITRSTVNNERCNVNYEYKLRALVLQFNNIGIVEMNSFGHHIFRTTVKSQRTILHHFLFIFYPDQELHI